MRVRASHAPLAAMLAAALSVGLPCDVRAQPEVDTESVLQDAQDTDGARVTDPDAEDADAAAAQVAGDAEAAAEDAGPVIQTLGEGDQRVFVVDHGDRWSMHAENMATDEILRLWEGVGGPELVTKTVLDRPYTISVHRLTAERVLARLLEGHGYTLHYDSRGRLVRVRVYSMEPTFQFKTPRLVESLGGWRDVESGAADDAQRP